MEGEMHKGLLPGRRTKKKRKNRHDKTHASYMKRMKASNNMNITRIMYMNMQERKRLLQRMEHINQWKQVSIGIFHGKRNK